ncbi:hypothetical protein BDA99DRAFT_559491 [Phascolomyces articulosus]|uniref:F-box domain-containing protein n=1 Tax=Phascolomyces articulosus TaxID=60185 RepID=A0AAD5KB12_9FUNG|nr:hypothetical protein BDA99DRAFT_559491 [Phascolomyces articulosus]
MLSLNNPILRSPSRKDQQIQDSTPENAVVSLNKEKLPTMSTLLGNMNDIQHVVSQWRREQPDSHDDVFYNNLGITSVPPLVSSTSSSPIAQESFSPKTPPLFDNTNMEVADRHYQQQEPWIHVLPYDILNQIFGRLSMHDLVVCLAVCRPWFSFIMNYPLFQKYASVELPSFLTLPDMFDFMLTRQNEHSSMHDGELNVIGQTKEAGETILRFIMYSARNFKFRSIFFKNWEYNIKSDEDTLYSLYTTLRQFVPHLETVSLINVIEFPSIAYLWRIFSACNNVKQLTIICNQSHQQSQRMITTMSNYCYDNDLIDDTATPIEIAHCVSHEPLYPISMTALPMVSLTYLKLSLPDVYKHHYRIGGAAAFPNIFPCCPNLQHLYMDTLDNIFHAHAIYEAFQHCPRLENIIVSPLAEVPPGIVVQFNEGINHTSINNYNNIHHHHSSITNSRPKFKSSSSSNDMIRTKNLSPPSSSTNPSQQPRRLVFTQGNCKGRNPLRRYDLCDSGCLHSNSNYLVPILKKHRTTLNLLYLQYDGEGQSASTCIQRLGQYGGAPQLRELHFVADGRIFTTDDDDHEYKQTMASYHVNSLSSSSSLISQQLATLISQCPFLQVLVVTSNDGSSVSMTIDNQLLQALGNTCSQLRHLVIRGKHTEITTQGLLDFSSATSTTSCLEHLDIDCCVWDEDLIRLITKLKQLKFLRLLNHHASKHNGNDQTVNDVLYSCNSSRLFRK